MQTFWLGLIFISLISGQLFRFSLFSPDVHFIPLDIVIGLFVAVSFLSSPGKFIANFKGTVLFKPILYFLSVCLFSLVLAFYRFGNTAFIVGFFYLVRWFTYTISFIAFKPLVRNFNLHSFLIISGVGLAVSGLIQYVIFPDVRNLQVYEWDPHYYRVVGSILDPGFIGLILVFTLLQIFIHKWKNKLLKYILLILTYASFVLTYSRSSYIAYFVSFIVLGKLSQKKHIAVLAIIILAVTIPLLPRSPQGEGVKLERTSSIQARLLNWRNSALIFAGQPVLGVGFNTYRYAQKEYGFLDDSVWIKSHAGAGADSSLLFVAATTGIIGLVAYLNYLFRLLKLPSVLLKSSLIGLLAHSLFLNSLFYPFILVWLAVLTAQAVTSGYKSPPALSS